MPNPFCQVTGGLIEDASGGLLARGAVFFTPVDANTRPAPFGVAGGGNLTPEPVQRPVTNGALASPLQLVRSDQSIPIGVQYQIRVQDLTTGWSAILGLLTLNSAAFDLGSFAPSTTQTAPPAAWVLGTGTAPTNTGPNAASVPYSATPTFDFSAGQLLQLTLADPGVTSSTATNVAPGMLAMIDVVQPPSAALPFAWPANLKNAQPVAQKPGWTSSQLVVGLPGGGLRAHGPIVYTQP